MSVYIGFYYGDTNNINPKPRGPPKVGEPVFTDEAVVSCKLLPRLGDVAQHVC